MSCCGHVGNNNINIQINNFNGGGQGLAAQGAVNGQGPQGMQGIDNCNPQQQQGNGPMDLLRFLADPLGILPKGMNPVDVHTDSKNPLNPLNMLNPMSPLKMLGLFG